MANATTILESLMWPNPEVSYDNTGGTLHENKHFHTPEKIIPWDEFNLDTIASIGGGKLLTIIQTTAPLRSVPPDVETEHCHIKEETDTRFLVESWNRGIVQSCLNAVHGQLPTCIWNPKSKKSQASTMLTTTASTSYASTPGINACNPAPSPSMTSLLHAKLAAVRKEKKQKKVHPDGGTTASCTTHGASCSDVREERMPKEYKAAHSWRSWEALDELLRDDGSGRWAWGKSNEPWARPLRQAFTYCLDFDCRYGCILTTEEAFVFRVRPADPTNREQSLEATLRRHGLMEYASIPWSEDEIEVHSSKIPAANGLTLTFNLAMWFMHVLAAGQFRLGWSYDALASEDITIRECTAVKVPPTPESEKRQDRDRGRKWLSRSQIKARKRAREENNDESYTHSFTSDIFSATNSFTSIRSDSAPTDSTCVNETPRRLPRSNFLTSDECLDNDASSVIVDDKQEVAPRRSKRARAAIDKS